MKRALPNTLTLLNLMCGASAIAALFQNKPVVVLVLAAICLVLDVCDGLLARRLNVSSELGSQLDSLADGVSFGVLPACILFVMAQECTTAPLPSVTHYVTFLFAGAVALRLARFNLDLRPRVVFYGLPTPSAATFVFGMLLMETTGHTAWTSFCQPSVIYLVVLLLALLMLTNLRLWGLKAIGEPNGTWIFAGLVLSAALSILFAGAAGIVLAVAVYLLFGLVNVFIKLY